MKVVLQLFRVAILTPMVSSTLGNPVSGGLLQNTITIKHGTGIWTVISAMSTGTSAIRNGVSLFVVYGMIDSFLLPYLTRPRRDDDQPV